MKPFNLQEALAGKAVKLRDGSKAFVRHHETELPTDRDARLTGFLAEGHRMAWCENGDYYMSGEGNDYDIIGMYPETRMFNGFEVPMPETVPLDEGTNYYLANPLRGAFYSPERWESTASDMRWLERGLVFLSEEDAAATAKAMFGINPYSKDKKNETI